MKPAVYDLVIYCGTTLDAAALSFTYAVGGTPVDLTGYTLRSKGAGPKGTVFDATTENGRIGVDPATGRYWFNFTAEQTAMMWVGGLPLFSNGEQMFHDAGRWDIELVSPDGRVVRLLEGKLLLSREVTTP